MRPVRLIESGFGESVRPRSCESGAVTNPASALAQKLFVLLRMSCECSPQNMLGAKEHMHRTMSRKVHPESEYGAFVCISHCTPTRVSRSWP